MRRERENSHMFVAYGDSRWISEDAAPRAPFLYQTSLTLAGDPFLSRKHIRKLFTLCERLLVIADSIPATLGDGMFSSTRLPTPPSPHPRPARCRRFRSATRSLLDRFRRESRFSCLLADAIGPIAATYAQLLAVRPRDGSPKMRLPCELSTHPRAPAHPRVLALPPASAALRLARPPSLKRPYRHVPPCPLCSNV